jgi:spoIIIJ-associated protein
LVDVEDYRKRRAARLVEQAHAAADQALDTGQEQVLEPMDALERKIVHDAIAEIDGVESSSRGEEPARSVVVRPGD